MAKTALITGGSRGIGYGIAEFLAAENMNIAIMDVQPEDSNTLEQLKEAGASDVLYVQGDVTKADDRNKVLENIKSKFGALNVLVNNAGISPSERKDILEASEESFEKVMTVNLQGPYFLTQAVANWMINEKDAEDEEGFCIVNISSISSTVASVNRGEYCLSKAGVSMATRLWATRLAEYNIPVYEVRPGLIQTPMTAGVKEKYDRLISEGLTLQKRWGFPKDIGKAVRMLATGSLVYSTGQVIQVDGGMTQQVL